MWYDTAVACDGFGTVGDVAPIQGRVLYSYRRPFVRVLVARRVPLPFLCSSRLAAPWTGSAFVWGMNFAARTVSALEKTLGWLRLAEWGRTGCV
jgi:hypothetical protein